MVIFFDKTFDQQVDEIIKSGDLKLLQAFIGIRSPVALLQYCASFFITKQNIANAKYYAYTALIDILYEYKSQLKYITADDDIEKIINIKLNLHESYVRRFIQKTDTSSLSTFDIEKIIDIYHNYIDQEMEQLKLALQEVRSTHIKNKYEYLDNQEYSLGYRGNQEEAASDIYECKQSLEKIRDGTFLDWSWYAGLVDSVINEVNNNEDHILHGIRYSTLPLSFRISFNEEVIRRVIKKLLSQAGMQLEKSTTDNIVYGISYTIYRYLSYCKSKIIDRHKVKHAIITEINQYITKRMPKKGQRMAETIHGNVVDGDIDLRTLRYLVENIQLSLIQETEQEVLNEILKRAVKQGKKDLLLLIVCNGGDLSCTELSLPRECAFSEVERLYADMLSITNLSERLPLLTLKKVERLFPNNLSNLCKAFIEFRSVSAKFDIDRVINYIGTSAEKLKQFIFLVKNISGMKSFPTIYLSENCLDYISTEEIELTIERIKKDDILLIVSIMALSNVDRMSKINIVVEFDKLKETKLVYELLQLKTFNTYDIEDGIPDPHIYLLLKKYDMKNLIIYDNNEWYSNKEGKEEKEEKMQRILNCYIRYGLEDLNQAMQDLKERLIESDKKKYLYFTEDIYSYRFLFFLAAATSVAMSIFLKFDLPTTIFYTAISLISVVMIVIAKSFKEFYLTKEFSKQIAVDSIDCADVNARDL